MENNKDDDVILFERNYQQRSFLRKKVHLTLPICALLILVFISSILIVSIGSFYWTEGAVCYAENNEQTTPKEPPQPRPVYISRPKRSPTLKKNNVPCLSTSCCTTPLGSNVPWKENRLPTAVYPVEYQLTLDLFKLNAEDDEYSGVVDILIEVRSATYDIVLHGADILISDVTVSQRSSPSNIQIPVDCVLSYPETQTFTIHLTQQVQVGPLYEVRIAFFRALNIHGTGLFEDQFNKDPFGIE
jgi:hypothetical protein